MTNDQVMNLISDHLDTGRFDLVDVTVVSTDGKTATADAVFTINGGDLLSWRLQYNGRPEPRPENETSFMRMVGEIAEECKEAIAYQRDLLRGKN